MELNAKALGLSIGIIEALVLAVVAYVAMQFGYGADLVEAIGSLAKGYEVSMSGIIIGAIWGFVGGFVPGLLIGWLYNLFS